MRLKSVFFLSLLSIVAFGQEVKISVVNKDAMPISFAYILVNGKPIAVSDTTGTTIINFEKLKDNDTISISYIGASSFPKIYDNNLKKKDKIEFVLEESGFMLDEAIVEYFDIKKFYNKSVKPFRQLNFNCQMEANFNASFSSPNQNARFLSGKIEGTNEVRSKDFTLRSKGWFHHPIKIITTDDTSQFRRSLESHLHLILNNINRALEFSIPNPPVNDSYKPKYEYLGERDSYKAFRILYPKTMTSMFPYHILVYVDEKLKEIHSIELETLTNSENSSLNKFHIKYDCIQYKHKAMNPVVLPINIHFTAILSSGLTVNIKITDPKIK